MKKTIKSSGSEDSFKTIALRKKRKKSVLEECIDNKRLANKASGAHLWSSEAGDTTESESIDMEEKCLVEETSVDYGESGAFAGENSDQTPKDLHMKTKKVLGKPLSVIDYDTVNAEDDVLDDFFFFSPPLSIKPSIQVSVCKSFALDIDLVAITEKFFQEKLNFIKKKFSGVNDFGGVSTPSKFGGIICVTFTSEKAIIAVANLANECGVMVNTNFKCSGYNHMNRAIVLKEISVGTSIEAVHAAVSEFGIIKLIKMQLAFVKLENQNQADLLASMWSILIGKDAVCVTRADIDKQTWDSRNRFRALLYTLSVGTNAYDLWNFLVSVGGKSTSGLVHPLVGISFMCNSVNYTCACCATVCFDSEEDMNWAVAVMPVIKGVGLYWSHLSSPMCSVCDSFGHTSLFSPISCSLAFGGKIWALVAGFSLLGESRLVNIKSSLVSLTEQIRELAKRLESFVPVVSQSSLGLMEVSSDKATSGKTAAILGSNISSEVVKLENMLEDLSASVMSLLAHLDGLALVGGAPSLPLFQ
ncbi:hypothetical protein G9A89_015219 [Geosiphon pyriformis]|nr:hypothetical protein G9A89_015219 [Geosiphon pyriformis]